MTEPSLDTVVAVLPPPYLQLTLRDCIALATLFHKTTRNPNHCISKGQYKTLVEQLAARNQVLQARVKDLEAQLAAGVDDGR